MSLVFRHQTNTMKNILLLVFLLLSSAGGVRAQTVETFDIATFTPPKGWNREVTGNSIQFSTEDKATRDACLIALFKSIPGPGNSKENFNAAWEMLVKGTFDVATAPQMQPSHNPEDWKVEMGSAPFEKNGSKGSVVLVTVSGYGKMINAVII